MKLKKHVDFDSLLSGVASVDKIAKALDEDYQSELLDLGTTKEKTASDKQNNDVADAMAIGAAGAGAAAYHQKQKTDKIIGKIKKHEHGKLGYRIRKSLGRTAKSIKKSGKKLGNALTLRDMKRERLTNMLRNSERSTRRLSKAGLGLAAGAAGLKVYDDYAPKKNNIEKNAFDEESEKLAGSDVKKKALSVGKTGLGLAAGAAAYKLHRYYDDTPEEDIRRQIATEVEKDSTPKGAAKLRGSQGALIGGLAGFMHGATKKGKIRGSRAKLLRGLWHGTAGAAWGGGAAGAAAYLKKKLAPDSEEDKQREYEKRLEKRAAFSAASIGYRSLAADVAGLDKEANAFNGPMDFTTPKKSNNIHSNDTTFITDSGKKYKVNHGTIKKKTSSLTEAIKGKGKADAAAIREKAFVNGSNKGKGILGGVRRVFSGLTSPTSAIGKFGRRVVV